MGGSGSGLSTGGIFGGLSTFLGLAMEALKIVANALVDICKLFGLIEDDEDPENFGDKAFQAEEAGIERDQFDTDQEYYEAVKNFTVDPERSKQISEQDKLAKGCEFMTNMISDMVPDFPLESAYTMFTHNTEYFEADGDRAVEITKMSETDPEIFERIDAYLTGQEKDADALDETFGTLIDVEKSIHPDKPENEIIETVLASRKID